MAHPWRAQMNFVPRAEMEAGIAHSGCALLGVETAIDRCGGGIQNCMYVVRKPRVAAELRRSVADGVVSFIESSFTCKVEYERWVAEQNSAGC